MAMLESVALPLVKWALSEDVGNGDITTLNTLGSGIGARAAITVKESGVIAGVEVADFSDLPREFSRVRIPEHRYAVFSHKDHISTIRRTVNTIWNHWLPASGLKAADAPNFERYDENFDSLTGDGGLEIWIPVKD